MGTLRGDNGGERPPEGGGVPDLPPEWGLVVIPDDAAELDDEAAALRREWRRAARINRWRRWVGLAPIGSASRRSGTPLTLPLLIMAIAIVATLTSLFALVWPNNGVRRAPASEPTATTATLADLTLLDESARPVRLRDTFPAVILLVDGCNCTGLISATASAAPPTVSVLAVARIAPPLPGRATVGASTTPAAGAVAASASGAMPAAKAPHLRSLADPGGQLMATFRTAAGELPGQAIAVLVRRGGQIARTLAFTSVDQIAADLARLS
jgi:hypothetical protein